MKSKILNGSIGKSFSVLSKADLKKVLAATLIQITMAILDLIGVAAIGVLGALSVNTLQSRPPGDKIQSLLDFLHLSNLSFESQIQIIGFSAVLILVSRTVVSIIFTRKIIFFLSRRGASISARLVSQLLSQPLLMIRRRTLQETLYALTDGVAVVTVQIIATIVVLASDFALLLVLFLGLLLVDSITALSTFSIFAFIAFILYKTMHVRAQFLGTKNSQLSIKSREKIAEVFETFRESVVRNSQNYYSRNIGKSRLELADTSAEMNFMPYISKYVMETSVVIGSLFLASIQFVLQDASHAVATLAIFLAAGSRIAPAVLRVQQGLVTLKGALGQARPTLDLIDDIGSTRVDNSLVDVLDIDHPGFEAFIQVQNVSMSYPNRDEPVLRNISFRINPGEFVAIVGPSGSGKTTLLDLILGLLVPDSGEVLISNEEPLKCISKWPGALAYVPQDVVIVSGSIAENVDLGFEKSAISDELIKNALSLSMLDSLLLQLPEGSQSSVGERGNKLSGGQRQRLGIARALFTKPRILFLDEATSSLDGQTEREITESIISLKGNLTVVTIAHRLSTVRNADKVIYLDKGQIVSIGTFEEVRNQVIDFDNQATLMGL
jgi:ABC-type multidrug transport system fused ATPase/permease subunit